VNKYIRGLAAALPLWLALAAAQTPTASHPITPNFQNVDIQVLANAVGREMGLTMIPAPTVRGSVNMVSPTAMTKQQFYQFFLQVLQVNGWVALRTGNIVKIEPEQNASKIAANEPERIDPNSDEIVTAVIEPKNVSAQQLNPVLHQLIPTSASLQSVAGTNALLISDHASNVARIKRIVAELDAAGGTGLDMVTLKNSNASDVVKTLGTLLTGAGAEAGAPKVVADDRSNSVLISGDTAARARIMDSIAKLDKPVDDNDNTERRYLKYANSDDVAAILKQQVSGSSSSGTTSAAGAPATPAAAVVGPAADRSVVIMSDKNTNLLIITAPPKTRKALWATVDAMDIARAKVLIEAIIADVSISKSRDLGVNWASWSQENGKVVPGALFDSPIGGTDAAGLATTIESLSSATSGISAPQGATFALGKLVDNGFSWAAMLRALTSDSNNNVIASPTQVTLDNEQVTLQSGQNVPFTTGQYTNTGVGAAAGSVNPFTTVQRQDVGTTLKITPRMNGSDSMTLTIDLDSSSLTGKTGDGGSQITNKRTFHNVVLVKDKQWLVVGGLIQDSKDLVETRVPLLSRIPIIGWLFKARDDDRQKTNLMVFIKATIIRDDLDASAATTSKYGLVQGDVKQQEDLTHQLPSPQLPALGAPPEAAPAGKAPQTQP